MNSCFWRVYTPLLLVMPTEGRDMTSPVMMEIGVQQSSQQYNYELSFYPFHLYY